MVEKKRSQTDLSKWLKKKASNNSNIPEHGPLSFKSGGFEKKPKLSFGFGYDPSTIINGIQKCSFSHSLKDGLKLYEFEPNLSYRIFNTLASVLKYKCVGSELRKDNTIIKNHYFITDIDPDLIVKQINEAIDTLFASYEIE